MSVVAESCQEQKIHSHMTHPCIPYSTASLPFHIHSPSHSHIHKWDDTLDNLAAPG